MTEERKTFCIKTSVISQVKKWKIFTGLASSIETFYFPIVHIMKKKKKHFIVRINGIISFDLRLHIEMKAKNDWLTYLLTVSFKVEASFCLTIVVPVCTNVIFYCQGWRSADCTVYPCSNQTKRKVRSQSWEAPEEVAWSDTLAELRSRQHSPIHQCWWCVGEQTGNGSYSMMAL